MSIVPQITKQCSKCGLRLPPTEFYQDRQSHDGHRGTCKECDGESHRRWQKANPERAQENNRRWRDTNLEKSRESHRRRYKANPEKAVEFVRRWQRANPEKVRKSQRRWQRAHPEKVREQNHRRRARKVGNTTGPHFTHVQFRALCHQYGDVCLCCGEAKKLVPDHVIPIARGGSNSIDNIQPLCPSCNSKKGTRIIDYRPRPPVCCGT